MIVLLYVGNRLILALSTVLQGDVHLVGSCNTISIVAVCYCYPSVYVVTTAFPFPSHYHALPYPALPNPTLPCPTLPYPILPCPTLPYPTLPCPILPYRSELAARIVRTAPTEGPHGDRKENDKKNEIRNKIRMCTVCMLDLTENTDCAHCQACGVCVLGMDGHYQYIGCVLLHSLSYLHSYLHLYLIFYIPLSFSSFPFQPSFHGQCCT